jgi:hypothetical protein
VNVLPVPFNANPIKVVVGGAVDAVVGATVVAVVVGAVVVAVVVGATVVVDVGAVVAAAVVEGAGTLDDEVEEGADVLDEDPQPARPMTTHTPAALANVHFDRQEPIRAMRTSYPLRAKPEPGGWDTGRL